MKAAFLSHTAMGGNFVVGSHHLAAAFAARGHEVLHVSAPVTPAHLLRVHDAFVRRRLTRWWRGGSDIAGVRDVVPFSLLPWALARRSNALMTIHRATLLASRSSTLGSLHLRDADCLLVDEPRLAELTVHAAGMLVYRATDLYAHMRVDASILELERDLCRRAHVLIGTSDAIASHLHALSGRPVHVIRNGVDFEHFARAQRAEPEAELPGERPSRAIYVGAFDDRFSAAALRSAAVAQPRRQFLLAGPGSERIAGALGLANIHALGAVEYRRLPALLARCAVGLLPFSQNAANAGRSPMKLYEYAAAGLCVAATSSLRAGSSTIPTLSAAATDDEFPAAVAQAFERAGDLNLVHRARSMARAQDWSVKADELLRLCHPSTVREASPPMEVAALAAGATWS